MLHFLWPMALLILSNFLYQICAKSVSGGMNPFASLTISYLVGAAVSVVLLLVSGGGNGFLKEYSKANWVPFVLGLVIVGLETGSIYAYKVGWEVSTAFIIQSAILATALLAAGVILYHETLSWNKVVGVLICLVGLIVIKMK